MTLRSESGFTIIEVMIAVVVLIVGMLGLVMTAALLSRMMGRSSRAQAAATYASARLEKMRAAACNPVLRAPGQDTLYRGGQWVAVNNWSYIDLADGTYRLRVITKWQTAQTRTRTDTLEMGIPCIT